MSFLNKKSIFVPILLTIFVFGFSFNFSKAEELSSDIVVTTDPVVVVEEEVIVDNTTKESTNDLEVVTEPIVEADSVESSVEPTPEILSAETSDEVDQSQNTSSDVVTEQTASAVLAPISTPTLTTDKDDYHPGETATIFGRFFSPLQNFVLKIFGVDKQNENYTESSIEVTSDASGSFSTSYLLDQVFRPFYDVHAFDTLGNKIAEMWFRDSSIGGYDQCANNTGSGFVGPDTGCHWINGALGPSNSSYSEGDATVQRAWLTGFAPGSSHTVTFQYGTTKAGKHAYDFLTKWDWSEGWITDADLCQDITGCTSANLVESGTIPDDPNTPVGWAAAQGSGDRTFVARGATAISASAPVLASGTYGGDSETNITVSFTVDDDGSMCTTQGNKTDCAVAIFFGAHVAKSLSWIVQDGTTGAGTISGKPYHVALSAFDGASIGNRDNQMDTTGTFGTITIIKDTNPNDQQDFNFQLKIQDESTVVNFPLDDDADTTLSNTKTFASIPTGIYTASELNIPNGWSLSNISCVDPSSNTSINLDLGTASINLGSGETVICTFTNTPPIGHIIVDKVTNPSGSQQSFNFTTTGGSYAGFSLIDGGPVNDQALVAGNYSVAEAAINGWDLTSATCSSTQQGDTSTPANISLQSGETITCTFTNTKKPTLTVNKVLVPNNDSGLFNLRIDGTSYASNVGNGGTTGAVEVSIGAHTVSELAGTNTNLNNYTAVISGDCNPQTGSVTLAAGDNKVCTITNTRNTGTLIVKKVMVGGTDTFDFTGTPSGQIGTDQGTIQVVVPTGQYISTEGVKAGWELSSVVCDDGSSNTPSVGSTANRTATFNVEKGETVTCTFTNTKLGHIIVDKVTDPALNAQIFNFDANGGSYADFSLTDAQAPNDQGLLPGAYSVTENTATGWQLTDLTCDDVNGSINLNTRTASLNLEAGETIHCTFTNTKLGTIIVKKETLPDGSQASFNFTRNFGSANFALTDGTQDSVSSLLPGNYSVAETVPAGWDLTSATCDDGSAVGSISLQAGETVTCTFNNTQRGNIVIVKDVIGNPDPTDFTFNNNFGGNHPASFMLDEDTNADLPSSRTFEVIPGTYAVSEVQLPHWQLESATCSDQSQVGAIGVAPGETVTCTFVNEELNKITLIKNTIGGDGTFDFTMTGATLPASAQITTVLGTKTQVFEDIDQDNTYTITEIVPAGWDLTSATCTGSNTPASITPEPGEDVTCTFTNTKKPTLTLQKTVVNDNGGTALETAWTLNANGPTPISGIEGNANVTNKIVDIGLYDLSESGPTGYTASAWVCTGAATQNYQDSVTLAAGENVTCVITNDDIAPKLHLRKVVVNDNGGTATVADFTLTADGTGSNDLSGTSPVDSGAGLIADTWALSETPLAGYTASDWVCVGGTQNGSNITVGIGGEATCTITNNDQTAHLKLVKNVINDNGGSALATDFTLSATGPTPISGNGGAENDVNAGVYNLSETTLPGYTPSAWSCEGGTQNGASISLALGQSATCTITNDDQQAYIIVDKTVINDNGGNAQPNDFLLKVDGKAVLDEVAYPVNPGSHTASETTLPGYTASAWGTNCNENGVVTVALGQTKTCTITNDDQQAYIKVIKVVTNDNGGTAAPDDFKLTLEGAAVLSGALTPVNPGTYTAGETLVLGYSFTGFSGDCNSEGDTTVALGETKTCTLTNDDIAPSLKLVKVVVGQGDPKDWTLTATGPTGFSGNGPEVLNGASFDAGSYDLSESGPAGYLASAWSCVGGTQNGAQITVGLDQDAVCTITNTKILALEVSKTANTSFTRTYNWTIDKLVDDNTVDLFVGDNQTVNYDVTVTKTGSADTAHTVSGTITIANPNTHTDLDATITSINDVLNVSGAATVDCGNTVFPYVLQNGAQLVCSYTKSGAATTDTLNTATVATSGLVPGGQGTAPVSFEVPPATMTEVNKNIDVTDTFGGALGSASDTKTFEYSRVLACGSEQGQYQGTNNQVPNTATITQTNQSDDQNVVVNCYGLTVTKDAATSYIKTWTWTIDKVGDQTALTLAPDQIVPVNYDVTVNATSQDSAWAVSGNITINNPAPMSASVTVSDALTGNINATVNCPANEVPANGSLVCTYTSPLPDAADRTNTATAALTNGTSFTGTAPVSFAEATVTVIDEEITIDDDKYAGNLGTLNANNVQETFKYTINVGPYTTTDCGTTDLFVNTATFTTNDTQTQGSDSHTVTVNVACVCSLTQGYWKTHNASFKGGAPADINWLNVDFDKDGNFEGEKETFFLSGQTWFQAFWTAPKGNPYYNLAHQYMAARLNIGNGASGGTTVTNAVAQATTLFKTYTPAQVAALKGNSSVKKQFTDLAGILGAFNEGITNPAGHCSEPPL